MAGPLTGLGNQSIPLSTPFKPGEQSNTQTRVAQDRQAQESQTSSAAAPADEVNVVSRSVGGTEQSSSTRLALTDDAPEQRRGSVVDLTV